jgi:RNA polymerase sigma-70 factor (ECF subfamily)
MSFLPGVVIQAWGGGSNMSSDIRRDPPTDEDLVHEARADPESPRSREAVCELFGRYRKRVYIWCYRYMRDHERALDLAQDVLLNAYRALGSFNERSRFGSWMYMVARNRCFNELRRPALMSEEAIDLDGLVDPVEDPAEQLIRKLDEQALLQLIHEQLDPTEQEALWLRCVENMPIVAITEVLSIDQASGARGVLQQARRKLRAALAEQEKWPATER